MLTCVLQFSNEHTDRAHCVHGIFMIKKEQRTVPTAFLNGRDIIPLLLTGFAKVKEEEEEEVLIFSDLP